MLLPGALIQGENKFIFLQEFRVVDYRGSVIEAHQSYVVFVFLMISLLLNLCIMCIGFLDLCACLILQNLLLLVVSCYLL